jgi:hypothetical protein
MKDAFELIREQIHEIRNIVGPVNLRLANMEHQITSSRIYLQEKTLALESKLLAAIFRLDKMDVEIAGLADGQEKLTEKVRRLEG